MKLTVLQARNIDISSLIYVISRFFYGIVYLMQTPEKARALAPLRSLCWLAGFGPILYLFIDAAINRPNPQY